METNALTIRNLTKRYRDFTLDNISLELPGGCVMGLIGENGAGKSTTIKAITGAVQPDGGEIFVLGCDIRDQAYIGRKAELGVVMDEACFPDVLTPVQVNAVMKRIYANWQEDTYYHFLKNLTCRPKRPLRNFQRA